MKPNLTIVDLDHTLLTMDSMRLLTLRHLRTPRVLLFVILRVLRLIPRHQLNEHFVRHFSRYFPNDTAVNDFCDELIRHIDPLIMERIRQENAAALILSASPENYVTALAARLGMQGAGSHVGEDGRFFYCSGENKASYLRRFFPDHHYGLGIGDSADDIAWLSICHTPLLYQHGTLTPLTDPA